MGKLSFLDLVSETLWSLLTRGVRLKDLLKQLDVLIFQSLNIILVCVSFAAAVTILEASFHMKLVLQNDSLVPGFAAMLIVRELAVVVMSLLLAAKIGAGIAAEIGQMKISEQIDALSLLGIDRIHYLVVPRLVAGVFGGAILSLIANAVCIVAASMVTVWQLDQSLSFFLVAFRRFVVGQDIIFFVIKGVVFCGLIPLVSAFYGLNCEAGAAGVGRATTKSVVASSIAIIVLDFILTFFFANFY